MVDNRDILADIMIIIVIVIVVTINFFWGYGFDAKIVWKHLTYKIKSELQVKMPPWSYSYLSNLVGTSPTYVVSTELIQLLEHFFQFAIFCPCFFCSCSLCLMSPSLKCEFLKVPYTAVSLILSTASTI